MAPRVVIFAIDPGCDCSAWVTLDGYGEPWGFATEPNDDVLARLRTAATGQDMIWGLPDGDTIVVIEQVEGYGMPVGKEVFETVFWSGRFAEAAYPVRVERLTRKVIKGHLCHSGQAKDANVRAALLERYGGKDAAIGRKAAPGPLYGLTGDAWSALAVAVVWSDLHP